MAQILDLQKQPLPSIGMRIKSISETPLLQVFQYRFCGTWTCVFSNDGICSKSVIAYELTNISWQDTLTGRVITQNNLLNLIECG